VCEDVGEGCACSRRDFLDWMEIVEGGVAAAVAMAMDFCVESWELHGGMDVIPIFATFVYYFSSILGVRSGDVHRWSYRQSKVSVQGLRLWEWVHSTHTLNLGTVCVP
jgi:hypothetical protein